MGWAHCGTDDAGREVGYGVAATCDHPGCDAEIDRGLAYCCGGMHFDNDRGCARYFCGTHLLGVGLCAACAAKEPDEDESPCPDGAHQWTGQQMGGPPDAAESAEWVGFCNVCGAEKTDDD